MGEWKAKRPYGHSLSCREKRLPDGFLPGPKYAEREIATTLSLDVASFQLLMQKAKPLRLGFPVKVLGGA